MQTPTPSDYFVTKAGSIPRLTHTNFAVWSNAIKYALIGTNTWDIVTGVEDVPQDGNVEYKEYYKRSNKAISILYGSITPSIQAYVAGVVDPAEMWSTICKTMDIVQNESGSTFMRDKFHHEVFNAQDTIDQYIGRILPYQDPLANTAQKLSNEDVITKLLTGLPAIYQVVKEIIFNQPDRTITSVIAALRRHAEITQPNLAAAPSGNTGATGNAGETTISRGLYSNSGRGGRGHGRFKRFGQQNGGIKRTESDICWYCSKKGHQQRNCHLKQKAMKYRKNGPREIHAHPNIEEPQLHLKRALVADATQMTPQANTWIVDPGASDHLCSDYFAFTEIAFLPQPILHIRPFSGRCGWLEY